MQKTQIILLVVAIIIIGFFVWNADKIGTKKNASILESDKNMRIKGEVVSYFPGANGYFVKPKAEGSYPGIVLIHENRGLRPETKLAADQLAKDGYMVLAVDLLGKTVETQEEAKALTSTFSQTTGIENLWNGVDFLRQHDATKIGSLGWCFGGTQSLFLAISGEKLDATAIYYGRLRNNKEELSMIDWPVLGIFGDKDQVISVENVNNFKSTLDKLKVENEIYIYPGVGHAFANPSGMNYAEKETVDAWEKTKRFFEKTLK